MSQSPLAPSAEEQIRRTIAEYCHFTDLGDYDRWVGLFTEDGAFHMFGSPMSATLSCARSSWATSRPNVAGCISPPTASSSAAALEYRPQVKVLEGVLWLTHPVNWPA